MKSVQTVIGEVTGKKNFSGSRFDLVKSSCALISPSSQPDVANNAPWNLQE